MAEFHAMFYPDRSTYEAEYVRQADGWATSSQPVSDGSRAIQELRKAFRQAGHPVWRQFRFILWAEGSFNALWGTRGATPTAICPWTRRRSGGGMRSSGCV